MTSQFCFSQLPNAVKPISPNATQKATYKPLITGSEDIPKKDEPSLEPEDPSCGAGFSEVVVGVVVSAGVSVSLVGSVSEDGSVSEGVGSVVDVSDSSEVVVSMVGVSDSSDGSDSLVGSVLVFDGFGSSVGFVSFVGSALVVDGFVVVDVGSVLVDDDGSVSFVDVSDSFVGSVSEDVGSELGASGVGSSDGSGALVVVEDSLVDSGSLVGSVLVVDGFGSSEGFVSVGGSVSFVGVSGEDVVGSVVDGSGSLVDDGSVFFVGFDSEEVGSELGGSGVCSSEGSGDGSGVGSGFSTIVTAGNGVAGAF
ncbi:hypothetical protein CJ203_10610 [Corynebacterium tuscaniense]|uniref:Uncharacterized protein n=1 Tax=Corynebacterium tuscaniense TaxID=302449 RepID=A0A2N6T2J5_9CORY|nr:hypothetical protein [Corynebacterium tuscaniense]PMC63533.1 hypothetical protein CJ203_10610 [Corynebacterium tuscaniense]